MTENLNIKQAISSKSHIEVARSLSDVLINATSNKVDGNKKIAVNLSQFRDIAWGDKPASSSELAEFTQRLLADLPNVDDRKELIGGITRLGQIYDIAAFVARDNVLSPDGRNVEEGSVSSDLGQFETVNEAIKYLNKPVFEVTMTAHPTNVIDRESILAMREIGNELDALRREKTGDESKLKDAIDNWVTKPVIPVKSIEGEEQPAKLTVQKETNDILNYLKNAYDDLPRTYEAFDNSIAEKAVNDETYNPKDLNLKMRFSSWGSSGDKDGNNNVTSETTLNAIALHKLKALEVYKENLEELSKNGNLTVELSKQQNLITESYDAIKVVNDEIQEKLVANSDRFLDSDDFDKLTEELKQASKDFNIKDFESAVEQQYDQDKSQDSLNFLRRVRTFGKDFGHIEYRETAESYSKVVGKIIDGYNEMNESERMTALTDALMDDSIYPERNDETGQMENKTKAQSLLDAARGRFVAKGQNAEYSDEKVSPIGYQTIRRIKLAREFPDMIVNNVLAESENASNILEAVFLQAASHASDNGRGEAIEDRAIMGVVPLFESPEVMKKVDKIMDKVYQNPAYQKHLQLVAKKAENLGIKDNDKSTQQIQIAHSDNTRRAGIPAARAFIHDAHEKLRKVTNDNGINVEFFEGGSNSDPLRGGLRSISAAVNQYQTHDFMKFTFQGGDMLNYFNYPGATERLYTRNISHAAKVIQDIDNDIDTRDHARNDPEYNNIAVAALKGTLPDYQSIFNKKTMGHFLTVTKDDNGNISSRANKRGAKETAPAEEVVKKQEIVDPQNVRTITFSESFQHAGVVPTFFGSMNIRKTLRDALDNNPEFARENGLKLPHNSSAYAFNKEVIPKFYQKSAVFRDVVDRMAFGIAKSDIEQIDKIYPELKGDKFLEKRLKPEYREAARIVLAAMPEMTNSIKADNDNSFVDKMGGQPKKPIDVTTANFDEIKEAVLDKLPHLREPIEHKSALMGVVQNIKKAANNDDSLTGNALNMIKGLIHAANDTVTHGLFLNASDRELTKLQGWEQQFPERGQGLVA